jgi:hypothetical protein
MNIPFRLMPLLSLCALLSGCLFGGSSDSDPQGQSREVGAYTVSGDKIIIGPQIYTDQYCDGSTLNVHRDTSDGDTLQYQVNGNTLVLSYAEPGLGLGQTIIKHTLTFARFGTGTGLSGTWRAVSIGHEVISGALTDSEEAAEAKDDAQGTAEYAKREFLVSFSGGKFSTFVEVSFAQNFAQEWNGEFDNDPTYADSARYDIELSVVDANHVRLKGRKIGETVDIAYSGAGDQTFTSSNPDHKAQTYYVTPSSCPNERPTWYQDFLTANSKSFTYLQKRGARVKAHAFKAFRQ